MWNGWMEGWMMDGLVNGWMGLPWWKCFILNYSFLLFYAPDCAVL